jgi:hypothetical protein
MRPTRTIYFEEGAKSFTSERFAVTCTTDVDWFEIWREDETDVEPIEGGKDDMLELISLVEYAIHHRDDVE